MTKELNQYRAMVSAKIADADTADDGSWLSEAKHHFFKYVNAQDYNALDLNHDGQITHEEYIASAMHFIEGYLTAKKAALGIRKEDGWNG